MRSRWNDGARWIDGTLRRALVLSLSLLGLLSTACENFPARQEPRSAQSAQGAGVPSAAESVPVLVEIPAGTNAKWELDKSSGSLIWEQRNGKPRVVQYLGYPGNYGMIPRTLLPKEQGGDGDPLDVLLLGPALERGAVVSARPIGVLRLLDGGESDDKILAVPFAGPLSDVSSIDELDRRYPGVTSIVSTWFANYKGPDRLQVLGVESSGAARRAIENASRAYETQPGMTSSSFEQNKETQ